MDIVVDNANLRRNHTFAKATMPGGCTKAPSMTVRNVPMLLMLLILTFASCTKNSQPQPNGTRNGGTDMKVQELRDSISRSLLRTGVVATGEKSKGDTLVQEKGSMMLDSLVGTVYVSGNEPFTRLTLALEDGRSNYFLEADTTQSKQLRMLQGRVVKICGPIVRNGMGDFIRVNKFVIVH
jgi:hypothetical protein